MVNSHHINCREPELLKKRNLIQNTAYEPVANWCQDSFLLHEDSVNMMGSHHLPRYTKHQKLHNTNDNTVNKEFKSILRVTDKVFVDKKQNW